MKLNTVSVKYVVGYYGFATLVDTSWPTVDGLALVSISGGYRVVSVSDLRDSREEAQAEFRRRGEVKRRAKQLAGDMFAVTLPALLADSGDVERVAA